MPSGTFLRPLENAVCRPPETVAWRTSITTWWSRILFGQLREAAAELLTTAVLVALTAPWFVGAAVMVHWLWVHAL